MSNKNFLQNDKYKIIIPILFLLLLAVIAICYYYFFIYRKKQNELNKNESIYKNAMISEPIDQRIESILNIFYDKRYNISKEDSYWHGNGHIKVVSMIGDELIDLYKKHRSTGNINSFLRDDQRDLIMIAVAFHDSGRVEETLDNEELSSALFCLSYLIEENLCDIKTAIKLAVCISAKSHADKAIKEGVKGLTDFLSNQISSKDDLNELIDKNYIGVGMSLLIPTRRNNFKALKLKVLLNLDSIQKASQGYQVNKGEIDDFINNDLTKNLEALVVYDADCIDVIRTRKSFDEKYTKYANIFKEKNSEPYKEFSQLQKKWESKRAMNIYTKYEKNGEFDKDFAEFVKKCEESKGLIMSSSNTEPEIKI